ncbi:pyridoxamine 5'-phosphate oxidase family protein [Haladaptatus sp. CMAA 1911]|uniref:pyridoxamine 5'-phosphate oxidase family protein n=1 Tax=unclassified Haladaptatus TaxID=2622732 RepID=UPI003754A206
MEHVEYVYTFGMDETELEGKLRDANTGVLSLARDSDSYAIPVSFHYDGRRLLLRFGVEEGGEKMSFMEGTGTASFVVYEAAGDESWSILVRGHLEPASESLDDAAINGRFVPLRVFGESISDVEPELYELRMESVTGRKT